MNSVERVKQLCKERGIPISKLEKDLGYANGYIGQLKKGVFPADRQSEIARYLNVSESYLLTGKKAQAVVGNIFPIELKAFPLLGEIAAGAPRYANESKDCYIQTGSNIKADFCLKVKGDSMINARIYDGDIVFIRKQECVENGEIAAVVVNSESDATLKRFYYYDDRATLILKAENPKYDDLIFQDNELNDVRVLGKAVAFQSDIK